MWRVWPIMTSRDSEIALVRIAEALEEIHLTLEKIEANTAPPEPLINKEVEQLFAIHSFYHSRLMDIITDENSDAFKKAKELRILIQESTNALEALAAK